MLATGAVRAEQYSAVYPSYIRTSASEARHMLNNNMLIGPETYGSRCLQTMHAACVLLHPFLPQPCPIPLHSIFATALQPGTLATACAQCNKLAVDIPTGNQQHVQYIRPWWLTGDISLLIKGKTHARELLAAAHPANSPD